MWVLKVVRAGGPPGMRVENPKGWGKGGGGGEKESVSRIWKIVVRLLQLAFGDGTIPY